MTVTGIRRGNAIEIAEPLPYAEGEELRLTIERAHSGNAAALLEAVLAPPHVEPEAIEEFLRAIEEGKKPISFRGVFDDLSNEGPISWIPLLSVTWFGNEPRLSSGCPRSQPRTPW